MAAVPHAPSPRHSSARAAPGTLTSTAAGFSFRFARLAEADLPLLHRWLNAPHVVAGYTRVPMTLEDVHRKYLARIAGQVRVRGYIVHLGEHPIGYVQTYRPDALGPEAPPQAAADALAIDVLIGDVEYTQRGLGPRVIAAALETLVWPDPRIARCLAGVRPEHSASLRAFRKAGFQPIVSAVRTEGAAEVLMVRQRP